MVRDHFRVLRMDLSAGRARVATLEGRDEVAGGSGLAALLFEQYGRNDLPWDAAEQPLIFAIGPLTGYFPLMSKTVCGFKSPYHDQYAESHAGGRSALALKLADYDALVFTGRAPRPSVVNLGSRQIEIQDVHYLWGQDVHATGKMLRRMFGGAGHRSILRIGPAGERGAAMAGINVDTFRHFGRLGGGAAMGVKNLKGIVIRGDASFELPEGKAYPRLFQELFARLTATGIMHKYHNLGTPANVKTLNALGALPWRNLQQTTDGSAEGITGETFAADTLLRNTACSGCPVGCIHVGFLREKFDEPNQFLYRQVAYDFEPIFAAGSMLGVTAAPSVLALIDAAEKLGLDIMSAGVALAWATEAAEKGLLSEKETIVRLAFGDAPAYRQAIGFLAGGKNEFYQLLSLGTLKAAARYGGTEFACVLGQEMAGYATGEAFLVSQALGLRHSHLDAGGYAWDQTSRPRDAGQAVDFLVRDERERVFLTSMVACLFAREVYKPEILADCLNALGYRALAERSEAVSDRIQRLRWKLRLAAGFDPASVPIPRRFAEMSNWKGPVDPDYLNALQSAYADRILNLGKSAMKHEL